MRKAALLAAMRDEAAGQLVVDDDDVIGALDELLEEGNALTRALLGAKGSTDADEG